MSGSDVACLNDQRHLIATAADDSGGGLVASAAGVFDLSSAVKQQLLSF